MNAILLVFLTLRLALMNVLNQQPSDYQTTITADSAIVRVWDEAEFKISLPINSEATPHIWTLPARQGMEYGGVEFAIELHARPASNVFVFPIKSFGLKFYKQLALTDTPLGRRSMRPTNIVDSYAVYHASKINNRYKAGKAFHIYRPMAMDASGAHVWGDMDIMAESLNVTIPAEFLANARYPVYIDPTLGYTSIGATTTDFSAYLIGNHYQMPSAGTATAYNLWLNTSGVPAAQNAAIYNSTGTTANGQTIVASTGSTSETTTGSWASLSISGSLSSGSWYYLPFMSASSTTTAYDTTGVPRSYELESFFPTFPSPFGASDLTNDTATTSSAYIDYTTGGSSNKPKFFLVPEGGIQK